MFKKYLEVFFRNYPMTLKFHLKLNIMEILDDYRESALTVYSNETDYPIPE